MTYAAPRPINTPSKLASEVLVLANLRTDSSRRDDDAHNSYPHQEQGRARDIGALYGNLSHLGERNRNAGRVLPSTKHGVGADGGPLNLDPPAIHGGHPHVLAGLLREYAGCGSTLNLPAGAGAQVADQQQ